MKVIIATGNPGKLREFSRILNPLGFEVCSQSEAGFTDSVEETGTTFAENAFLKADAIYQQFHCPTIADDSGLEVMALNNRPGVYSARYSGEHATDEQNNDKLLEELQGKSNREAQYVCCICYLDQQGQAHYFTGTCKGEIGFERKGTEGFGYDPLFMIGDRSFGQYTAEEKDAISHRGKALRAMAEYIQQNEKENHHADK